MSLYNKFIFKICKVYYENSQNKPKGDNILFSVLLLIY